MSSGGIEYLYLETHNWAESVELWEGSGFKMELDLGSAGRFVHPNGGSVFIEEVPAEAPLKVQIFLKGARSGPQTGMDEFVVEEWHESHWGSYLKELRDPDGRTIFIQERE